MLNKITKAMLEQTLKTAATTACDIASTVLDKGAEYSDNAKKYIESLDSIDTTKRDTRNEDREPLKWPSFFNDRGNE